MSVTLEEMKIQYDLRKKFEIENKLLRATLKEIKEGHVRGTRAHEIASKALKR